MWKAAGSETKGQEEEPTDKRKLQRPMQRLAIWLTCSGASLIILLKALGTVTNDSCILSLTRRSQSTVVVCLAQFSRRALKQPQCGDVPGQTVVCTSPHLRIQVRPEQALHGTFVTLCRSKLDLESHLLVAVTGRSIPHKGRTSGPLHGRKHNARTVVSLRRCQVLASVTTSN